MDAAAQSTCASAINNTQTSVTLLSASGFATPVNGQQFGVVILDSGNSSYSAANPLATPYEYQQVNGVSGNVLTFGPGGGAAARSSFAGTTPKSYFAGATIAAALLAEDLNAGFLVKLDERLLSTTASLTFPASGTLPTGFRHLLLEYQMRGDTASINVEMFLRFNGDSGVFYGSQRTNNSGTGGVVNQEQTASTGIRSWYISAASAAAGAAGWGRIWIPWYQSALWKTCRIDNSFFNAASLPSSAQIANDMTNGVYISTAAITSITILPGSGNLATGIVTLSGIP